MNRSYLNIKTSPCEPRSDLSIPNGNKKNSAKNYGVKPFLYIISYNNFNEAKDYKRHLDTLLSNFNHRLTFVPNNFSIENYKFDASEFNKRAKEVVFIDSVTFLELSHNA